MWAAVLVFSLVVPGVAMVAIAEWVMRRADRRERLRLAREGATRTTLGTAWLAHQERREAARALRNRT